MMSRLNSKYALVLLLLIYFGLQLLFVAKYYTDKTVVPPQIAESMAQNSSIVAKNFSCYIPGGGHFSYPTWAEEPPIFHGIIIAFKFLGMDLLYYKLFPLICFVFIFFALLKIAKLLLGEHFEKNKFLIYMLLLFQPYFFIHTSRILPDDLALAFFLWTVFFMFKRKYIPSLLLAYLAVTTKVLAIFPLAFIVAHYFFFDKRDSWVKKTSLSALYASSILPTLGWFYYLSQQNILNPFFSAVGSFHHLGDRGADIVWTSKLWGRVLHFGILKGTSIVLFLLLLVYLLRLKKFQAYLQHYRLFFMLMIGYIFMVFVVKDLFLSAPWYSFYFISLFIFPALFVFVELKQNLKTLIVILVCLSPLSMVKYSWKINTNVIQDVGKLYIDLPCKDFLMQKANKLK